MLGISRKIKASRPVSRVLYGPAKAQPWQPFFWDTFCNVPQATYPDDRRGTAWLSPVIPIRSCSRWGLPCRQTSPPTRWALTPPFHPYPAASTAQTRLLRWRGGLLSVALSLGSPPPDVIRHRCSMEPGLSSFRSLSAICDARLPGRLAVLDSREAAKWPEPKRWQFHRFGYLVHFMMRWTLPQ